MDAGNRAPSTKIGSFALTAHSTSCTGFFDMGHFPPNQSVVLEPMLLDFVALVPATPAIDALQGDGRPVRRLHSRASALQPGLGNTGDHRCAS